MAETKNISLKAVALGQKRTGAQAAVIGIAKGQDGPEVLGAPLPKKELAALVKVLPTLGVTGGRDEVVRVAGIAPDTADVIVLVGLGDLTRDRLGKERREADAATTPDAEALRRAAGAASRSLKGLDSAVFLLPAEDVEDAEAIAEGAALGAYEFTALKSAGDDDEKAPLAEALIATELKPDKELKAALQRAAVLSRHAKHVRDLVNTPANILYPESFAEHARTSSKGLDVKVTVWDEKKLAAEGMGGILGVGGGSHRPPRLVRVSYSPSRSRAHLSLVGKGITFDTGGISLKPAPGMEEMKSDMAGAATVLHTVLAAAELGLPVQVTAWLCLAENMPGGEATRPGDVLTMYNGKTVEVTNTDAEGRLVMADGLSRASEDAPDVLVDIATLTGAQVVALGNRSAGLMGDDAAVAAVSLASDLSGEVFWPMPSFPEEIREDLDSATADLRNSGDRSGGMLKAGAFLREFVGAEGKPAPAWAHLDIAGPSFNSGKAYGYTPKEGTGFGLRTLVELADGLGADE